MTLKNIEKSRQINLADLVSYNDGQIISRTLVQNQHLSMTLFAFDTGEEISSHSSGGDAMVTILDGSALITIGDKQHTVTQGQTIVMPAEVPHALKAQERFKMQLTVVF
ncbi:MAG: cupin domain-containing protein [Clostridia bacterium]|nr:cupin domain-containing protein [Clostridia bacterium]